MAGVQVSRKRVLPGLMRQGGWTRPVLLDSSVPWDVGAVALDRKGLRLRGGHSGRWGAKLLPSALPAQIPVCTLHSSATLSSLTEAGHALVSLPQVPSKKSQPSAMASCTGLVLTWCLLTCTRLGTTTREGDDKPGPLVHWEPPCTHCSLLPGGRCWSPRRRQCPVGHSCAHHSGGPGRGPQ